jgi:hypothetical protein
MTPRLSIAVCLCLAAARYSSARHAFGAEFDPNRPVLLKGAVTKVEWVNPHELDPHRGLEGGR